MRNLIISDNAAERYRMPYKAKLNSDQLKNLLSIVDYYKEHLFERHTNELGQAASIKQITDIQHELKQL